MMTDAYKEYWIDYKDDGEKLAKLLGYGFTKSFDDLYQEGVINAFGHPENSVKTLTIYSHTIYDPEKISDTQLITSIEIYTKYFAVTETAKALINELSNKPMSFEDCFTFINNNLK